MSSDSVTQTAARRNVLVRGSLVMLLAMCANLARSAPDPRDLMKRSIEAGQRNTVGVRAYTFENRVAQKQIETDGSLKSQQVKTYDIVVVEGLMVRKLVSKDDKPLPADEARKEDQRVKRLVEARKSESPSQHARRLDSLKKKREKELAFNDEILNAFDFRVTGQEALLGRQNWVVDATPRPGYKPNEWRAQIFPHLKGRVWIDQEDLLWSKADAKAFEPISIGFSLVAKLEEGARLFFVQERMDTGVWVLQSTGLRAIAHVAVVKRIGIEQTSSYRNYRRVAAGTDTDGILEK